MSSNQFDFPKLQALASQDALDEGIADTARRLKAKAGEVVQGVKSALNRDTGGKDTDPAGATIAKEFDSIINSTLMKANTAGRAVHRDLVQRNVTPAEMTKGMLDNMLSHVATSVNKFRKGVAVKATVDNKKGTISIAENPSLVRPHPLPLVTLELINPLPPENEAKGPYYKVRGFAADLEQRVLNLQRLLDKGARPIHPEHVADAGHPEADTKPAPAADTKPAPKPAPADTKPAPAADTKPEPSLHDVTFAGMQKLWKTWTDSGKNASPEMRRFIKQMWLDAGGIKAESILRSAAEAINEQK